MNQKNEKPAESKVSTNKGDNGSDKPVENLDPASEQDKPTLSSTPVPGRGLTGNLPPEIVELVMELKDTVKRIDPRKHTVKTLRRSLSNVSDILSDIDKLNPQN